jgi:hypothetical protein
LISIGYISLLPCHGTWEYPALKTLASRIQPRPLKQSFFAHPNLLFGKYRHTPVLPHGMTLVRKVIGQDPEGGLKLVNILRLQRDRRWLAIFTLAAAD